MDLARNRAWLWIAAAALVAAGLYALLGGRHSPTQDAPRVALERGAGGSGPGASRLWVHVSGEVRRPGLYRVPAGARVGEAVQRAGGPSRRAELGGVNLAAQLRDGQQVAVPRRGAQAVAPAAGGGSEPGARGAPVSLATASAEQLDTIDGIGPTLAGRIVEYREQHGGFASIDELRQVDGIGEKRFEALREGLQP